VTSDSQVVGKALLRGPWTKSGFQDAPEPGTWYCQCPKGLGVGYCLAVAHATPDDHQLPQGHHRLASPSCPHNQ